MSGSYFSTSIIREIVTMKKAQVYRRLGSFWRMIRDFFVEEEPREKARRTMRDATRSLNRVIYQRMVLEHELKLGTLDGDTRHWCEKNLELLRQSEEQMAGRLTQMREEYRTLMMQDLYYAALNDPGGEAFEEAQQAIMELQASVESERTIRAMPRHLPHVALPSNLIPQPRAAFTAENGHAALHSNGTSEFLR
jgi:hypothetical protein